MAHRFILSDEDLSNETHSALMDTWGGDSWKWGVAVCTTGCAIAALGLGLQKKAHMARAKLGLAAHSDGGEDSSISKSIFLDPMWLSGMVLVLGNTFLDVVSYGLAAQSLIAPLAALTTVFNAIAAPICIGSSLNNTDMVGVLITTGGVFLTLMGGNKDTPTYDIEAIKDLFYREIIAFFFVIMALVLGILVWLSSMLGKPEDIEKSLDTFTTGWIQWLVSASYSIMAGILGGVSLCCVKVIVELLKATFTGSGIQFKYFEFWLFSGILAICLIFQTRFLNAGLMRFDALFVIPIYQVSWIYSGALCGFAFFKEFKGAMFEDVAQYIIGCVFIGIGVGHIAKRQSLEEDEEELLPPPRDPDAEEEEEDEEEDDDEPDGQSTPPPPEPTGSRPARGQRAAMAARRNVRTGGNRRKSGIPGLAPGMY